MHAGYSMNSWFDFSSEKTIKNSKKKSNDNTLINIILFASNPIVFSQLKFINDSVNFSSLANTKSNLQDTNEEESGAHSIYKKQIQIKNEVLKSRIEALISILESTPKKTEQNKAVTLALIKTARKGVTKKNFDMISRKERKAYHEIISKIEATYLNEIK